MPHKKIGAFTLGLIALLGLATFLNFNFGQVQSSRTE
jgi:hypothetical protein